MLRATSRPSPVADTSTWATLREVPRCAQVAAISAPAKSGDVRNWTPPAATSPSHRRETSSAYERAAARLISERGAARCTPRRAEAGFAACTFPVRWDWNRAAAAFALLELAAPCRRPPPAGRLPHGG